MKSLKTTPTGQDLNDPKPIFLKPHHHSKAGNSLRLRAGLFPLSPSVEEKTVDRVRLWNLMNRMAHQRRKQLIDAGVKGHKSIPHECAIR